MSAKSTSADILNIENARAERQGGQYRDAGAWLASVREDRGVTLEAAASRTHIRLHHLHAIEEMNLGALPARPYAIGFVKAYAEFLELDPQAVIDRFKEDTGLVRPAPVETEKFEEAADAAPSEKPELSLIAVVVILAFILWCAWQITLPRDVRQLGAASAPAIAEAPEIDAPTPQAPPPEDVVAASITERVEPIYPMTCLEDAAAVETVTVTFTITSGGRVSGERIGAATNDCFATSALNALRRWRFEPRTVGGAARPAFGQSARFTFEKPV